jgi:peptidoglycan/LPS O-acetylase OafA/YrhL
MGKIRFLLAISVVIAHSGAIFGINLVGGQIAVQAFYIISGFYMSLVLNEKYINGNNSYKLFLSNRLLRLYPIYWVTALIVLLNLVRINIKSDVPLGALGQFIKYHDQMSIGSFAYLILTNIVLVGQDIAMFMGLDVHSGNMFFAKNYLLTDPKVYTFLLIPQAWTIGVEIDFYIIAPFIVRKSIKWIILLMSASLLLRIILIHYGYQKDPWSYRFFPTELFFFLLGNICYRIYKKMEYVDIRKYYSWLIISLLVIVTVFYDKVELPFKPIWYFAFFALTIPFVFKYTKYSKADYIIGELSYPIYICHMVAFAFIPNKILQYEGPGLAVAIFAIGFSILLNRFVAKPIEKIRQKRVLRQTVII